MTRVLVSGLIATLIAASMISACTTPGRVASNRQASRGIASNPLPFVRELEERLVARLLEKGAQDSPTLRNEVKHTILDVFSDVDQHSYASYDDLVKNYEKKSFTDMDAAMQKLSGHSDDWNQLAKRLIGLERFVFDDVCRDVRAGFTSDLRMTSVRTSVVNFKPKSADIVENKVSKTLREKFIAGNQTVVLHGQTNELFHFSYGGKDYFVSLEEYVSKVFMSGRDVVVLYDVVKGVRFVTRDITTGEVKIATGHPAFSEWLAMEKNKVLKDTLAKQGMPTQPSGAFLILDQFFNDMADKKKIGFVIDHGQALMGRTAANPEGVTSIGRETLGEQSKNTATESVWLERMAQNPALTRADGKGVITVVISSEKSGYDDLLKRVPTIKGVELTHASSAEKSSLIHHKFKENEILKTHVRMTPDELAHELDYMSAAEIDLLLNEVIAEAKILDRSFIAEETAKRVAAYTDGRLSYLKPKGRRLADWAPVDPGSIDTKKKIQQVLDSIDAGRLDEVPLNQFLLGLPGTGKSEVFGVFADELNRRGYSTFMVGQFEGKYLGESEANMRNILSTSDRFKKTLLIMDEFDMKVNSSPDSMSKQAIGFFFEELAKEEYAGRRVFLAASSRGPSGELGNMGKSGDMWSRFQLVYSTWAPRTAAEKKALVESLLIANRLDPKLAGEIPDHWWQDGMSLRVARDFYTAIKQAKRDVKGAKMTGDDLLNAIVNTPAKHSEEKIIQTEIFNAEACGLLYDAATGVTGNKALKRVVCMEKPNAKY